MKTVEQLMDAAFSPGRDPRSEEYMRGCIAALQYRIHGATIRHPYQMGTTQADAYFAGIDEGHAIWRRECLADEGHAQDSSR